MTNASSEATPALDHLLDRVQHGEQITITRRGKPVARLVPYAAEQRRDTQATLDWFRTFRKSGPRVSLREMLEWRHEGRKY